MRLTHLVRIGWSKTNLVSTEAAKHLAVVQQMSKSCEFELVPQKHAVHDSGVQVGNHNSESEVLIFKSDTACWRKGELFDGSMGSKTLKGTRIPEQVQDEDFSISVKKRIAQILKRDQSLLQYCKIERLLFYKTMDPTNHYKTKADEVYDGSGEGLQPRYRRTET